MEYKPKVLAVGDSFTRGHGLAQESQDPRLWVNQLFPADRYQVNNVARTGANNHWIFLETVSQMMKNTYDTVIVGWTTMPRYNFQVGLELYTVDTILNDRDINVNNNLTVSGKWLQSIGDNLKKIHNDHWNLLELVKYVNVLLHLEKIYHTKIIFVNAFGPWSKNYFDKKDIGLPSDLDPYTHNLLEADRRDDDEVFKLYDMIHDQYKYYGGIQSDHWLNLYDSLFSRKIDNASETDRHPGYQSQDLYYKWLSPIVVQKLDNRL
jgi:hypothetical protein